MWALSYYLTQLSLGCQSSCQQTPRGLETRCGREGHTRPRGPSESPDGVDPNIRRTIKTQRDGHNSGVKIWSLCSVSSILSHATLEQPLSNPCNKVRGKICCWRSLHAFSFLRPLFVRLSFIMRLLSLRRYVSSIYIYATPGPLLPRVVVPVSVPSKACPVDRGCRICWLRHYRRVTFWQLAVTRNAWGRDPSGWVSVTWLLSGQLTYNTPLCPLLGLDEHSQRSDPIN